GVTEPAGAEINRTGRVAAPQETVRAPPGGLTGTVPHLLSAGDAVRSGIGKPPGEEVDRDERGCPRLALGAALTPGRVAAVSRECNRDPQQQDPADLARGRKTRRVVCHRSKPENAHAQASVDHRAASLVIGQ